MGPGPVHVWAVGDNRTGGNVQVGDNAASLESLDFDSVVVVESLYSLFIHKCGWRE